MKVSTLEARRNFLLSRFTVSAVCRCFSFNAAKSLCSFFSCRVLVSLAAFRECTLPQTQMLVLNENSQLLTVAERHNRTKLLDTDTFESLSTVMINAENFWWPKKTKIAAELQNVRFIAY